MAGVAEFHDSRPSINDPAENRGKHRHLISFTKFIVDSEKDLIDTGLSPIADLSSVFVTAMKSEAGIPFPETSPNKKAK